MATKQIAANAPRTLFHVGGNTQKLIFTLGMLVCLFSFAGPALALLLGIAIAQLTGHPFLHLNHKATHILLQLSVVGLGFGMNMHTAMETGRQGILLTVVFICGTLLLGYLLASGLKIERKTSYLIAAGTAICGGSAIAAISPVIKAEEKQISVALGCVFVLNAVALFVFPPIGHYFHLSQTQFGLWCAIAIHDTSSVIGAASKYGAHALEIATTVKLTRALWIIPVAFISAFLFNNQSKQVKLPYFIGLFVLTMLFNTWFPFPAFNATIVHVSKIGLVVTLFLIGSGLSPAVLKNVGVKPLLMGVILWTAVSVISLLSVMMIAK
jgi:uncharacterized integral membrane protein (TIGR00698 family)